MKIKEFKSAFSTYTPIKGIGSGGSGHVLLVKNADNEIFALKYLAPENITPRKIKRFRNELSFCAKNTHKNILTVLDLGFTTIDAIDCPFYIMPYYEKTLRDLINDEIDHNKILEYFSQMLDGVEAGHLQKVYHRDLKPENILFNPTDNNLIIADYGIAHFNAENIITAVETRIQERLANFQYAAPEQKIKGADVNHKADIYALGMILNEMFTKTPPSGTDYKKVGDVNPDFVFLDNIINLMLSQSPKKRPENIDSIKLQIGNNQKEFISRQKLSELKNRVIPKSELDDDLIDNPVKLVDVDYINNNLILKLNRLVNEKWIKAFNLPKSHSYIPGYNLNKFNFYGDHAKIFIQVESTATRLAQHFKNYLVQANKNYKEMIVEENAFNERQQRQFRDEQIQEEEKRRRVIESVDI